MRLEHLLLPLAACAALAACDPGGQPIADAGVDAAGAGDGGAPDADTHDASGDAGGQPAMVTVTVYDWRGSGQVVMGAHALFLTSAGGVVSRTTTDSAGTATGLVPAGGQLLIVDHDGNLTSYVGLEDGDQLVVGQPTRTGMAVNGTVTVPAAPGGATRYQVVGRCATGTSTTTTITVGINDSCAGGPRDLLVTASNAAGAIGYLHAPAVAIAPATTTPLTGTWATPGSFAAQVAGVPAEVALLRMSHLVYAAGSPLSSNLEVLPPATGGVISATFPHPIGVGDASLTVLYATDSAGGFRRVASYTAPTTTLQVPDLAAAMLPAVTSVSALGDGDATWTVAGTASVDGIVVTLDALEKGASRATWRWVLRGTDRSLSAPVLPADLAGEWTPIDGVDVDVTLIESSSVATSRQFRETVFTTARRETFGAMPVVVRTSSRNP